MRGCILQLDDTELVLRQAMGKPCYGIRSVELKPRIGSVNEAREYFFQTLSNSAWASKAELLFLEEPDDTVEKELQKLGAFYNVTVRHFELGSRSNGVQTALRSEDHDYFRNLEFDSKTDHGFDDIRVNTIHKSIDRNMGIDWTALSALEDQIAKYIKVLKFAIQTGIQNKIHAPFYSLLDVVGNAIFTGTGNEETKKILQELKETKGLLKTTAEKKVA